MRLLRLTSMFLIILVLYCATETDVATEKILARVGDITITENEFQNRANLSPQVMVSGSIQSQKQQILAALLAEKIFVNIASKQKMDTLGLFQTIYQQMQKEAIVEVLFDQEIEKRIKITESEIAQGLERIQTRLKLAYFKVSNKQEAELAAAELTNGQLFETVGALHMFRNPVYTDSIPVKELGWGQATQVVEDSVYQLKPAQITGPIQVDDEFYFFKLLNRQTNPHKSSADPKQWRSTIVRRIRNKRRESLFSLFIVDLLRNTKVTIPNETFEQVAHALESIADQSQSSQNNIPRLQPLNEGLFSENRLGNIFNKPLVRFSDGSHWTVKEVLQKLQIGPYPLNYKSAAQLKTTLRFAIRSMIELETLAQTGVEKGLEKSNYYREESRLWYDYLLANRIIYPQSASDSSFANPENMEKILLENYQNYEIKIDEQVFERIKLLENGLQALVTKKHFPGRYAAPPLPPVHLWPRWQAEVTKIQKISQQ